MPTRKDLQAAVGQFQRGEVERAEAGFREILARDPDNASAHNNLGVALRARGEPKAAAASYLRALALMPGNGEYFRNLGTALAELGQRNTAAACYLRASQLFRNTRRPKDALAASRLATQVSSSYPGRIELGVSLLRNKRYAEAGAVLGPLAEEIGRLAALGRFLGAGRDIAEVQVEGETLRFRVVPDDNVGVASAHVDGRLYEQAELERCRELVAPGAVIVDVGANIGNHLVYFARVMKAKRVVPVEPHPEAVRQIRDNIALNGITCVDESCLGIGAGETPGQGSLVAGVDLAQVGLRPGATGAIRIAPLDELITGPVDFIKIDVEGSEIGVLRGSRGLLERHRPLMLVEVADANLDAFRALLQELGYVARGEFRHGGYRNIFVEPAQPGGSRP